MPTFGSVLIYDGDCPFCSAAASAMRRIDDVGSISWNDEAAQAFLEAQFDDVPFALVLVDRDAETVFTGREAARELCGRAGVPALVGDVVGDNYETLADAVRTVAGQERDPDPYHDVLALGSDARQRYGDLAAAADDVALRMSR